MALLETEFLAQPRAQTGLTAATVGRAVLEVILTQLGATEGRVEQPEEDPLLLPRLFLRHLFRAEGPAREAMSPVPPTMDMRARGEVAVGKIMRNPVRTVWAELEARMDLILPAELGLIAPMKPTGLAVEVVAEDRKTIQTERLPGMAELVGPQVAAVAAEAGLGVTV